MHDYTKVLIRFTKQNNYNDCYDLTFKLLDNTFVPKWIERINQAKSRQDPISEPWAMKRFNQNLSPQDCLARLNQLIDNVNAHEKLFDRKLKDINDQDTLNQIHSVFEKHHGKLDEWLENPLFVNKPKQFREWLSQINQFVHLCEQVKDTRPSVRIVWFDLPKTKKFSNEDYKLFTNKFDFGVIYSLYADVGKNIEALTEDDDDHHHDFVPNIHYSADCRVDFGTLPDFIIKENEAQYKKYIHENRSMLESSGYTVDDPRLTAGHIPIAKLITDKSESQIVQELSEYDYIQDLVLL